MQRVLAFQSRESQTENGYSYRVSFINLGILWREKQTDMFQNGWVRKFSNYVCYFKIRCEGTSILF